MTRPIKTLAAVTAGIVLATSAFAGSSPLVAIENEPAPKLIAEPPLAGPLARGAVLHVSVDDLPWRWGHFDDTNTIVVNGLPPGPHKVLIELADPEHRIFSGQAVTFTVPALAK